MGSKNGKVSNCFLQVNNASDHCDLSLLLTSYLLHHCVAWWIIKSLLLLPLPNSQNQIASQPPTSIPTLATVVISSQLYTNQITISIPDRNQKCSNSSKTLLVDLELASKISLTTSVNLIIPLGVLGFITAALQR